MPGVAVWPVAWLMKPSVSLGTAARAEIAFQRGSLINFGVAGGTFVTQTGWIEQSEKNIQPIWLNIACSGRRRARHLLLCAVGALEKGTAGSRVDLPGHLRYPPALRVSDGGIDRAMRPVRR